MIAEGRRGLTWRSMSLGLRSWPRSLRSAMEAYSQSMRRPPNGRSGMPEFFSRSVRMSMMPVLPSLEARSSAEAGEMLARYPRRPPNSTRRKTGPYTWTHNATLTWRSSSRATSPSAMQLLPKPDASLEPAALQMTNWYTNCVLMVLTRICAKVHVCFISESFSGRSVTYMVGRATSRLVWPGGLTMTCRCTVQLAGGAGIQQAHTYQYM